MDNFKKDVPFKKSNSIECNYNVSNNTSFSHNSSTLKTVDSVYVDNKGEIYSDKLVSIYFLRYVPDKFPYYPIKIVEERNNLIIKLYFQLAIIILGVLSSSYLLDSEFKNIEYVNMLFLAAFFIGFHGTIYVNYATLVTYCLFNLLLPVIPLIYYGAKIIGFEGSAYKCNLSSIILTTSPLYYNLYCGMKYYFYISSLFKFIYIWCLWFFRKRIIITHFN